MVYLKSGDVYSGELASYPITLDTEQEKDFLIRRARYYKGGNFGAGRNLEDLDSIGAVLLNTANVDSMILYYENLSPTQRASGNAR